MNARAPRLDRATIRGRLAASANAAPIIEMSIGERLLREGNLEAFSEEAMTAFVGSHRRTTAIPPPGTPPVPAAVLVPLIEHREGFAILLTQRTDSLKRHAGQIAFPGGRMDPEDRDAEDCALREAREEIGLDTSRVEVLGRLRPYLTGSGYAITPVVGAIAPPVALSLDPVEVASAFEVPLAFLLDASNHKRIAREFEGNPGAYYAMPYENRYIWGATAAMLVSFYETLVAM